MKMRPISFTQEFSNTQSCYGNSIHGFEEYREKDGSWVHARTVELIPGKWDGGHFLQVKVYNNIGDSATNIFDIVWWDHNRHEGPKMSEQQKELLGAIYRGDIRGQYAEDIMWGFFIDLCIMDPSSKIREYLPEFVNLTEKNKLRNKNKRLKEV